MSWIHDFRGIAQMRLCAVSGDQVRWLGQVTRSLYLSSFGICLLSSIFNIFSVLKLPKRRATTSLSRTSKRGRSVPQPISLLRALRMRCPPLVLLSPLSQPWRLLQYLLLLESPPLVHILDNVYLIYEIYLILESPTNYYLRMFHLIVVSSTRSDRWNIRVSTPSM